MNVVLLISSYLLVVVSVVLVLVALARVAGRRRRPVDRPTIEVTDPAPRGGQVGDQAPALGPVATTGFWTLLLVTGDGRRDLSVRTAAQHIELPDGARFIELRDGAATHCHLERLEVDATPALLVIAEDGRVHQRIDDCDEVALVRLIAALPRTTSAS